MQFEFLIRAEDHIHAGYGCYLLWLELCIATDDDDLSLGVTAQSGLDHLAGLFVGILGDGAGIDDIIVGALREVHLLVAIIRQHSANGGGLAEVEFAAESGERYFSIVIHRGCENNEKAPLGMNGALVKDL